MNSFLQKALAISAIIVAFAVGYYFFIFLPQQAQTAQKQQQDLRNSLTDCLNTAQETYDFNRAQACKPEKEILKGLLVKCKNPVFRGNYTEQGCMENECKTIHFSLSKCTPDGIDQVPGWEACGLDQDTDTQLNNQLQSDKNECYRQYPVK